MGQVRDQFISDPTAFRSHLDGSRDVQRQRNVELRRDGLPFRLIAAVGKPHSMLTLKSVYGTHLICLKSAPRSLLWGGPTCRLDRVPLLPCWRLPYRHRCAYNTDGILACNRIRAVPRVSINLVVQHRNQARIHTSSGHRFDAYEFDLDRPRFDP